MRPAFKASWCMRNALLKSLVDERWYKKGVCNRTIDVHHLLVA